MAHKVIKLFRKFSKKNYDKIFGYQGAFSGCLVSVIAYHGVGYLGLRSIIQ